MKEQDTEVRNPTPPGSQPPDPDDMLDIEVGADTTEPTQSEGTPEPPPSLKPGVQPSVRPSPIFDKNGKLPHLERASSPPENSASAQSSATPPPEREAVGSSEMFAPTEGQGQAPFDQTTSLTVLDRGPAIEATDPWAAPLNSQDSTLSAEERPGENWLGLLLKETLETVVLAVVIFLLIRVAIQNYRIEGSSMEPNFHNGEYLLVNKLAYRLGEYQRGDVIVFKYPNDTTKDYIKRVIGLPGDIVEIREGMLYVNGQVVTEPYAITPMNFINEPPRVVEEGTLYVMGDNRPASSDTRDLGLTQPGIGHRPGVVGDLPSGHVRTGRSSGPALHARNGPGSMTAKADRPSES